MKPLIGINLDIVAGPPKQAAVQANYYESVLKAGGIPVLIAPMPEADLKQLLSSLNGILFIGGLDYEPGLYGEKACDKVDLINNERQKFDLALLQKVVRETQLPVLGICGGCQILNIGLGGSLIQDIPSAVPGSTVQHASKEGWKHGFHKHVVKIVPDSKLANIYSRKSFEVPTSHHQAVKDLGKGLKATAHTDDGIIEAVEMEGRPFVIGVQWHPERDFVGNQNLFSEFIKQSSFVEKFTK